MTRVFIWKNNSPQEWEEISFSAFSKARRNGCFTGRFFVETVKMFRDEDDRIIMECSRKDFEKYQQEDRHSRYLQEHEKSRSIFPASHVGDRDGTEEGYQDTDLFVDESVDTAEQAICIFLWPICTVLCAAESERTLFYLGLLRYGKAKYTAISQKIWH